VKCGSEMVGLMVYVVECSKGVLGTRREMVYVGRLQVFEVEDCGWWCVMLSLTETVVIMCQKCFDDWLNRAETEAFKPEGFQRATKLSSRTVEELLLCYNYR